MLMGPWDFNVKQKRDEAEAIEREKRALLLIGSPMCSAFSQLQNLNFARMTEAETNKVAEYGKVHLEFCMKFYKIQHENKLYHFT